MKNLTKLVLTCTALSITAFLFSIFSPYTVHISVSLTPTTSSAAEAAPAKKPTPSKPVKKSNDQLDIAFELAPELETPRGLLNEIFILSRKLDALRKEHDATEKVVMSLIRTNTLSDQSHTSAADVGRLEQRLSAVEGRLFSIEAALRRH